MKALTLHQPWASLIALGHKRIETRGWQTAYRGPLAIHAGVSTRGWGRRGTRTQLGAFEVQRTPDALLLRGPIEWPYALPLGFVTATCQLVDVVPIHEQLCHCDPPFPVYAGIGVGGLGRDILALYHGHEHPKPGLAISRCNGTADDHPWQLTADSEAIIRQIPYGDFRCGRFAWLLDDVQPVDPPVPAKGRQGLWKWTP